MKAHNKTRFVAVTSVMCVDEDWTAKPWYENREASKMLLMDLQPDYASDVCLCWLRSGAVTACLIVQGPAGNARLAHEPH